MTASAAASQALIVQGASGQTANMQEWQNNGGGVLSRINSSGQFVGDGSQLTGVVATDVGSPVTMNMVNAKTTTTNGGITITTNVFVSAGNVGIGTVSPAQRFTVVGTSSMTASAAGSQALIVQGASGQTANLQEWQSNAGSVLSRINSSGQFIGDGSQLTGVVATDVGSPVTLNVVNAKTTTTNGGITITTNVFVSAGNLGIGTTNPQQVLEVNGGTRLNTATAQPACDSTKRGTFWVVQGGTGVKDNVQVCAKDTADAYAWRVIY